MASTRVTATTSKRPQETAPQVASAGNTRSASSPHAPVDADPGHGLLSLLEIEKEAREADNFVDLHYILANQTPKLTAARQAFVFELRPRSKMNLVAVTGVANVDRTVPLVHTFERFAAHTSRNTGQSGCQTFDVSEIPEEFDDLKKHYPFRAMCWLPLKTRGGEIIGAILLARERSWTGADIVVATRLAGTFQHAWEALSAKPRYKNLRPSLRPIPWLVAFASLLALAIPVPMTTLAPLEIIPADPFIVAAPIDGVIKDIAIDPNATVRKGDLLVTFENTTLKNQLELAERELLVASARLKRATQLAFSDKRGRHDLGIARAELALKTAERDYAADLADNSTIEAERDGVAIFSGKTDLLGKPLAVGERIMQIANPSLVYVRIDIPLGDSIILRDGAHVSLYLDSSPLHPIAATIIQANYKASKTAADTLSYKIKARINDADQPPPRLGVRGTAQIFSDKVSLGFYLFRKPLSALRQTVGF